MTKAQQLTEDLKQGKLKIEEVLHPEKQLADFKPEDLYVDILPSGFDSLDEYLLLKRNYGELVIIGGRPSNGKTAFMCQIALNVSQNHPVQLFSLEMGAVSIRTRMLASHLKVSATDIQKRRVDRRRLATAITEMQKYNYFIDDRSGLTVKEICNSARALHRKVNTQLIVVDYLQLVRTAGQYIREQEIGDISQSLKELARELNVPVVVGCQLSRAGMTRGNGGSGYKPILSDLRESGRIEQDADIVAMVHRPCLFPPFDRQGEADVLIVKNRMGSVAEINMKFESAQTRFVDASFNL